MNRSLQKHNIVLLGIGHTNAHVVKMWRMHPIQDANLICVSNFPIVTYSGMLPGVLSGQYDQAEMEIDLVRFCSVSGARLIVDAVSGVDCQNRLIEFENRPPLPYHLLSIGIGSRPSLGEIKVDRDASLVAIKPMQTFLKRLTQSITDGAGEGMHVNIIGAGVGGVELAFCLKPRLARQLNSDRFSIRLLAGEQIGSGLASSTQKKVARELEQAGVEVIAGVRVSRVAQDSIELSDGRTFKSHLALLATGAIANVLHDQIDLPKDDKGFILTRSTLQSVEDERIFAVGDTGTNQDDPTPKAGVFAVRHAPILWENLQRKMLGKQLVRYRPQRDFLKLLNLGDGRAIAEYRGFSAAAKWCWRLKDHIDGNFMRLHQDYRPASMTNDTDRDEASDMRCLGCGGKLGGASLTAALSRLQIPASDRVVLGLQEPDDAAVIRVPEGETTVTTDFFAAPFDDPYTVGRIAAQNAASDCFAMNAQPTAALAIAQVPTGHELTQSETLFELLSGAQAELTAMDTPLAGGHSIEGPRLLIGFTLLSRQVGPGTKKSNLAAGDVLILTKPLGTGVLLAGLMRGQCHARWFEEMIQSMLQSNQIALQLARDFSIAAMTDVTGFGLAGHLIEMLTASKLSATIDISRIPQLTGASELLEAGIQSSLSPKNEYVRQSIAWEGEPAIPDASLLFDPQTSGGLLLGIHPARAKPAMDLLASRGFTRAAVIGEVKSMSPDPNSPRLTVRRNP